MVRAGHRGYAAVSRDGSRTRGVLRMRNVAISADASFQNTALRWTKSDLPISLPWRSMLWRATVPTLWAFGWAFWIWVLSVDTPDRSLIFYALLFVGIPVMLAVAAAWWVGQFLHRRQAGTLVVNDDYLEWQFETGSNVELLADCGRFEFVGKRNYDTRIEWDIESSWDGTAEGWPRWARKWVKPDRTLYARDLGLDREDLQSLCKLLNELREETKARG